MTEFSLIMGSDHAGFELKTKIIKYLKAKGITAYDAGTYSTDSCDYPVIAQNVSQRVANKEFERIVGEELAKDMVDIWLNASFEAGRHEKRIEMIEN